MPLAFASGTFTKQRGPAGATWEQFQDGSQAVATHSTIGTLPHPTNTVNGAFLSKEGAHDRPHTSDGKRLATPGHRAQPWPARLPPITCLGKGEGNSTQVRTQAQPGWFEPLAPLAATRQQH